MKDLIERQAAIDDLHGKDPSQIWDTADVEVWLNNLPSAQPEQRWISSGKKPLKEGSYLVWMPFAPPKHRMAVAEYCGGYWNIKTPISAWMPLPEPYKEGQDGRYDQQTAGNHRPACAVR